MAGVLALSALVLHRTRFGRAVYAVGGNPDAARLAGIRTERVTLAVYTIAALLAGLAGIVQVGRLGAAAPVAGTGVELTAAAAILIGGTSFTGGVGGVMGTTLGVVFVGVLRNGLGLLGISAFWQDVATGVILIAAVSLDRALHRDRR
jgi:ribose/xylose/arabinose/galactoside ABC-type transport system permease subunit